jgi:hypothetical protein
MIEVDEVAQNPVELYDEAWPSLALLMGDKRKNRNDR